MKVSDRFKTRFSEYLKSYLPQELVQHPGFQTAVLTDIEDLAELSSLEVCESRIRALSLSCEPPDLAERILKLADGTEFLAGARFKNLNTDFPFIEVQLGFDMTPERVSEIRDIAQSEFRNLRPLGLKFKDKPNSHPAFEKWSHTVFGKIEKRENPPAPSDLSFSFTQNLDWHSQYVQGYQERLTENKNLEGFVRVGLLEEFQEAAADQALVVVNDVEGFCGVIAGIKSPLYGRPAIYMIESYLSKRWIGKKVAPMAHAFFLNGLATRFDYVWGTIYDGNLPSLSTARRIGRRIVETEYFIRFD